MIYYINECIETKMEKNAGSKARNDVEQIFRELDMQRIQVYRKNNLKGIKLHLSNAKDIYHSLKKQDIHDSIIFFQFPLIGHSIFNSIVFKKIKHRNNKVVAIIHDLEFLRFNEEPNTIAYKRVLLEEFSLLNICDEIIVHNGKMKEVLTNHGVDAAKMIELGIFDYIIKDKELKDNRKEKSAGIAIAGNLKIEKSGYIYKLPDNLSFVLYGANFCEEKVMRNVKYRGSFYPDELVFELNEKFGLVWDGNSIDTCDGNYGEYLKYNNPHKTSLYLAGELPVIIWEQAALANFILKNKIGIVIGSLNEIDEKIKNLSEDEYRELKNNAIAFSKKIRTGYFMKTAIKKSIDQLKVREGKINESIHTKNKKF